MDAVEEPVNWSQIAVQAFEAKLAEIARRRQENPMEHVVQRLRASRSGHEDAQRSSPYLAGRSWAADEAEWWQLEELEQTLGTWTEDDWEGWRTGLEIHYKDHDRDHVLPWDMETTGPIYVHVLRITGDVKSMKEKDCDWSFARQSAAEAWWKERGAGDAPSTPFVREFCSGALDLFAEVKRRM